MNLIGKWKEIIEITNIRKNHKKIIKVKPSFLLTPLIINNRMFYIY